jgi:hypothetical protein
VSARRPRPPADYLAPEGFKSVVGVVVVGGGGGGENGALLFAGPVS